MKFKRTIPPDAGRGDSLSSQMKRRDRSRGRAPDKDLAGATFVSTGSTLLDLAISGGRVRGGGIPSGILVEIFGPAAAGKTVMLCELAGAIQRLRGDVMFCDPEARLNNQFAQLFGFDVDSVEYNNPNTVTEVFRPLYSSWEPSGKKINGYFADSLAALSTDLEMDSEEGDKMGMRRAKEFSQELRKIARILPEKNILMVCSNQVRQNLDAGPYGQKYRSPGGEAIGFYCSLRLRCRNPQKIKKVRTVKSQKVSRVIGVETEVEVFKSSVWKPYHVAPLTILFDYGIDDVRQNLQYVKAMTGASVYAIGGEKLDKSIEASIAAIEEDGREKELREEVIELWEEIEAKFDDDQRKAKTRR